MSLSVESVHHGLLVLCEDATKSVKSLWDSFEVAHCTIRTPQHLLHEGGVSGVFERLAEEGGVVEDVGKLGVAVDQLAHLRVCEHHRA